MSYTTYLAHHGIKGQKWGVRRFQNYDGTRIKNESTQKIKIPKGPYYKWGKERGIRIYDRTKAGNKLFEVMHSTASDVINKLNEDGQMTKTYQDVCKAGWAFTGGVKFNDIRDEYVHAYYDKMERDSTYDYRKCYNSTYDSFQEPNISDKSAFVKILHDAVDKVMTKDVWKEDPNMPSWKESQFYKVQNANPDSTEVQSAYADILKNGKILYEKENRLISLIKKENSRNRLSNDEEQECQELLNDLSYSHGDGRSDFVRPEHSDEWRKHMRDKAYDPGLSEERLFYRIQDPEEVSHAVITNYDIPSYENYLAHHGIKGQKWGVRRFQKADGSLTAAGAKRYGIKSAMSAGRKVGAGLVKAARGGIQKAKEAKARKAAEKLERQKKVWAKTRLGLTMNADKFTAEELREANNRLDERDRAARGLAEQVKRGVGYFQAIRDVTGAIKDTKDYLEDLSGEKDRKRKAEEDLKYERQLAKEERDHQRALERDKASAERDIDYKREKDQLDRESRERINKYTVDAKNKKDDDGSSTSSAKPKGPDDDDGGGGSGNTIRLNGKTYDADFMKKTNPEAYEYAMKKQKEDAHNARLDYLEERTKKSDSRQSRETSEQPKEKPKESSDKNQNEGENHINQHRVDRYKEFASNIDASDLSPDDKVKFKKSFYSKVKSLGGDNEDFNLETERSLDIAKGLKNAAEKRKATEARQKAEAEANREETTAERQKRKVEEAKAYGAEAQYQANKAQLDSMSDSQLAKMAFQRKKSEVIDAVKSFNPKAMAEKYLAAGEREKLEKESKKIAEISVENLGSRYSEMVRRNGQEAADYAMTEYTENMRRQVDSISRDKAFVGKTYTPDSKRMEKDRTALNNKKTRDQIDTNVKEIDTLRKKAEHLDRLRGEGGGDLYWNQIAQLEEENRKLRNTINHSDISAYGAYLAHHGIKGQKWGVRRFQNYDGTRINKNHTSNAADTKQAARTLNSLYKKYMRAEEEWDDDGMDKAISQLGHDKSFQKSVKPVVDIVNSTYEKHKDVFNKSNDAKSEKMQSYLDDLQKIDDCVKSTAKKLGIKDTASDSYKYNFFTNALAGYIDSMDQDEYRRFLQSDWIVHGVLEHHGIKGQKWGIRRFQNEDGTRIIKKGTRFKRTSIHEDDPTFDDKKYVSTNNRDARKWRDYLGNAYAQRGRIVYEHEYKTTKDIAVARGKDISAVINEEFKKNPKKWKQLNADTERAMKMLNYVKDNMSDDDRYSTNFAAQTNSGKEIMRMLQKRGYDAVEDLHGRNVSDDPIIVFNPDENLKHKKVKQHWEYYYRNMYG